MVDAACHAILNKIAGRRPGKRRILEFSADRSIYVSGFRILTWIGRRRLMLAVGFSNLRCLEPGTAGRKGQPFSFASTPAAAPRS
jgi:hypothetical protein